MADVNAVLEANRDAVRELIAAAERCQGHWTVPRAPGKWSPSQVVEHVARSLEESSNMISGAQSALPRLPFFLRPVARMFFNRMVRTGVIPKGRAAKALQPTTAPSTPVEARQRLEAAFAKFDRACRARGTTSETVNSSVFGTVPLQDYARFMEIHTRHHSRQMETR
jgi:hypothetical protein